MKRIIFAAVVVAATVGSVCGADAQGKAFKKYVSSRRYCVGREVVGDKVITHWYRDGKPDTVMPAVVTNVVRTITGVEQNNPIQNELEKTAAQVVTLWNSYTNQLAQTTAYSNAYVVAQGVAQAATAKIQDEIADLQAKIVKYEEYQKKYPIAKSIFAAMITDAENRIRILQTLTGGAS